MSSCLGGAAPGLDEGELSAWLQKGLGRAVLRLREADARPFRRAILHACTYNLAYDRQLDCEREVYLLDVIEATANRASTAMPSCAPLLPPAPTRTATSSSP